MTQLVLKWVVVLAALFAGGPLAASFVAPLRLTDGSHAASLFTDGSSSSGLLAGFGVLALASVMGLASGRLVARDMGLTVAGLVVAWAAWRFSTVDRAASRIGGQGMLATLSIEGLLIGLFGAGMALAISLVARERLSKWEAIGHYVESESRGAEFPIGTLVLSGLVGLLAGGFAVWLVATEALKGQCVMAAVIGGVACGAASQLFASTARFHLGVVVPMLAFAVLAGIAPIVTMYVHGKNIVEVAMGGDLFALGKPGPFDWLAGGLLGVPIGIAWANSMLEKEPASATA
jgi:hypothetical protein